MNDDIRSNSYDKEMPSRFLTDATIMGSTPRLNLENVFDDPFLIKAKENQIIALSDQITQINRENQTETYKLLLKHQLLKLHTKKLRKRDSQLKKRYTSANSREPELEEALEQKKISENKMKQSKINFEKSKHSFEEILEQYNDFLLSQDGKTSETDQLEMLENFAPDFNKEGEEQADMEERIYLVSQIKEKERDIAKSKQNYRNAQFQELVYDAEFAKINCVRNILKIQADHLQQQLEKLNKRYDVASMKKSKPYDPVHYEDGLIEQIEKVADESEKRLTRSRVDAIEYDLQHEFSSYQALKNENKERKRAILARRNNLIRAKQKQAKRSKIIQQMTPKSNTNTSFLSRSGSPQNKSVLCQKKQEDIDQMNQETEEIDKKNKEFRINKEKEYNETMQILLELTAQLSKLDEEYVNYCNYRNQVEKARLQENDTSIKLEKLTKQKQQLAEKVKKTPGKERYADKALFVSEKKKKVDEKENDLVIRRVEVAKKKADVDELQKVVDDASNRYEEILRQISQMNNDIDFTIVDIEKLSNNISLIQLDSQKKHEEEEEYIASQNQNHEVILEEIEENIEEEVEEEENISYNYNYNIVNNQVINESNHNDEIGNNYENDVNVQMEEEIMDLEEDINQENQPEVDIPQNIENSQEEEEEEKEIFDFRNEENAQLDQNLGDEDFSYKEYVADNQFNEEEDSQTTHEIRNQNEKEDFLQTEETENHLAEEDFQSAENIDNHHQEEESFQPNEEIDNYQGESFQPNEEIDNYQGESFQPNEEIENQQEEESFQLNNEIDNQAEEDFQPTEEIENHQQVESFQLNEEIGNQQEEESFQLNEEIENQQEGESFQPTEEIESQPEEESFQLNNEIDSQQDFQLIGETENQQAEEELKNTEEFHSNEEENF